MELALYAPGLGYYVAGARKFGEAGDYVTAPEISPLFARCLARQCRQVLDQIEGGDILEFGAGSGAMATDMLLELETLNCLPQHYYIIEVSPDLQQRQRETLLNRAPHLQAFVSWLDKLPQSFHGVVLANEVIDAMPVHLLQFDGAEFGERYVAWEAETFVWVDGPLSTVELQQAIVHLKNEIADELDFGYITEINLALNGWIAALGNMLTAGAVLLIDYGFPRHEYYHPDRNTGTLMCHYRHRSHPDPFVWPGLQDITAHVDFTAVAEAADAASLDVAGYTSQAQFLLGCGLGEILQQAATDDVRTHLTMTQAVKKLTLPSEMGELFKVMALTRSVDLMLQGFSVQDRRHRL
ncbi:MAG: SAM-dependent methyltransferase [Gammaproteobacteria bacterium]|nr:SAM-dependent methyltransferase [Gammaproteobacteria bacterium]